MTKPPKSQGLLEVKAVEKAEDGSSADRKRHLIVTAHRLWIDEGRDQVLADLQSVRLSAPDTVEVLPIGRSRPLEFRCRRADEAQRLRACLVFHAKYTRGGIPGVETWTQLVNPPYDRVDVSDASMPAGASPAVDAASAVSSVMIARSTSRRSTLLAVVIAAVLVVGVIAAAIYVVTRPAGGSRRREGMQQQQQVVEAADKAFARGNYGQAAEQYRQALALAPRSADLNARLGECLFHLNQSAEAAKALQAASDYGADQRADVQALLAACLLDTGKMSEAYRVLQRARGKFPDDPELSFLMARILAARNTNEEALRLSRKVFDDHPDHTPNARLYATLLDKTKKYKEAAPVYLDVARRTNDFTMFINAVVAAGKARNLAGAGSILTQARAAFPRHPTLVDKTNDEVLIALGVMEKPPEPEPEPEPETGTTTPETGTQTGTETTPETGTETGTETTTPVNGQTPQNDQPGTEPDQPGEPTGEEPMQSPEPPAETDQDAPGEPPPDAVDEDRDVAPPAETDDDTVE
jgi:tetratricopeptide (TPR) repeat protein